MCFSDLRNATQAAIRCGYSAKTAKQQGSRLLTNVDIAAAVAERAAKQLESADLSATRVLEEIRRLALSDVRQLFDESGNLRPLHTLTVEQAACIAGLEVVIKNAKAGDGITDTVLKLKFIDRGRYVELAAKHQGMLTEKVEHSGGVVVKWQE